mgnify:CR=1 FL=1
MNFGIRSVKKSIFIHLVLLSNLYKKKKARYNRAFHGADGETWTHMTLRSLAPSDNDEKLPYDDLPDEFYDAIIDTNVS